MRPLPPLGASVTRGVELSAEASGHVLRSSHTGLALILSCGEKTAIGLRRADVPARPAFPQRESRSGWSGAAGRGEPAHRSSGPQDRLYFVMEYVNGGTSCTTSSRSEVQGAAEESSSARQLWKRPSSAGAKRRCLPGVRPRVPTETEAFCFSVLELPRPLSHSPELRQQWASCRRPAERGPARSVEIGGASGA